MLNGFWGWLAKFLLELKEKWGTKFIVTVGVIAAGLYLAVEGFLSPVYFWAGAVLLAAIYMIIRGGTEIHAAAKEEAIAKAKAAAPEPTKIYEPVDNSRKGF